MVRRNLDIVSDDSVRSATGQGREHWFDLLDRAGAASWDHPAIARHLAEGGMDGWWAQNVTVAYEQARGLRLPGQRSDGTFDASASLTIPLALNVLWPHLVESASLGWLDGEWGVAAFTEGTSVRFVDRDGRRAVMSFYGSDGAKTRLAVQIGKLASPAEAAAVKAQWKGALANLAKAVS